MQPLAIVFYERLMPGSQLVNRLQDLGYRVQAVNNAAQLAATVQRESPLVVLADVEAQADVLGAITRIKTGEATQHIPLIAFAPDNRAETMAAAQTAGARLAVGESTLAAHLPTLLDQVLQVE
jgi:CheY-like chemotaxis protein